jgi:hypothetical protein
MGNSIFRTTNLPDKVVCSVFICLMLASIASLCHAQQFPTNKRKATRYYGAKRKLTSAIKLAPLPILARRPANSFPDPDELMLAKMFGGPGAIAAGSGFEPYGFQGSWSMISGANRSFGMNAKTPGHLLGYSMHLYGSQVGVTDADIYIPDGFDLNSVKGPTEKDAVYTFYYPELMGQKNITIAVFHVANFGLRHEGNRWRIGTTGGPGGDTPFYRHSHLEVHRGKGLPFGRNEKETLKLRERTRLHFRDFFCRQGTPQNSGMVANARPSTSGLFTYNSFQASTQTPTNLTLPSSLKFSTTGGVINNKALTDIDAILESLKALSNELLDKKN